MSIRPIDYQVILPKTSEVSKINNEMQQKDQIIQQHNNVLNQKQNDRNLRQVIEKNEPYKVIADHKGNRNKQNYSESKKDKRNKVSTEKNDIKTSNKEEIKTATNKIDIRI